MNIDYKLKIYIKIVISINSTVIFTNIIEKNNLLKYKIIIVII